MNKIFLYPFIVWSVFSYTTAWTQTKHHQSKFYNWEDGQWKLVETTYQSWYPNGLSKATKTFDEVNQTYSFYDSTGYNPFGETVYYQEWKRNSSNTAWVNQKKFEYLYDANNQIISGAGFQWLTNQWNQTEGFQRHIQWDVARLHETIVQTTYDPSSNTYKNAMKFENVYNTLGQVVSSTVLMANPTTLIFENYSRDLYSGWHSVSDDIPTVYIRQQFRNNQWNTLSTSTTVLKSGLWETISVEENGDVFKTIFDSQRKNITRMQVVPDGFLLLYDKQTSGKIITQQWNQYDNQGQLAQVHIEEEERDAKGQMIRTTDRYAYNGGTLAKENEVLFTYTYNSRGELVSLTTTEFDAATGQTNFTGKVEYLEYRNVSIPLATKPLEPESPSEVKPSVSVFPNPFAESVTIQMEGFWSIHTAEGRGWMEGNNPATLSTSDWPSGIYVLQTMDNQKPTHIKILKK